MKLSIDEAKAHRQNLPAIAASVHMPDEAAMLMGQVLDKIIAGKDIDLPKKYHFLFTLET